MPELTPQPDSPSAEAAERDARFVSSWTTKQKIGRVLWAIAEATIFRWSGHPFNAPRRALLRLFGATVGKHCVIRPSVRITIPWHLTLGDGCVVGDQAILYALAPITLKPYAMVSQYAHLCAGSHDHTRPDLPLTTAPITIGENAWVAADAFVGPGVTLGDGCVLGARSAAFKDLPPHTICTGTPAKPLKPRDYAL
ncbi:MAG: WcaF family extracellular polysaccharide biosynthesis acetyltransferase [Planctomycetota bacterium]